MLTSAKRGETLTPYPNECNSTLTSGTKNIYPYPIDVNDQGHRLRSGSPVTNLPGSAAIVQAVVIFFHVPRLEWPRERP